MRNIFNGGSLVFNLVTSKVIREEVTEKEWQAVTSRVYTLGDALDIFWLLEFEAVVIE
jgi:hypothetical protein